MKTPSGTPRMISTTLDTPSPRHEPLIPPSPSRPQRKTGLSNCSAQVLATSPRSDGLHSGFPKTIADGLLTSLGSLTFRIILNEVDQIVTVSEEKIVEAMRMIWERMKIVIEPSSATVLAIVKENPELFRGKKIGLIISGGNVDFRKLPF